MDHGENAQSWRKWRCSLGEKGSIIWARQLLAQSNGGLDKGKWVWRFVDEYIKRKNLRYCSFEGKKTGKYIQKG